MLMLHVSVRQSHTVSGIVTGINLGLFEGKGGEGGGGKGEGSEVCTHWKVKQTVHIVYTNMMNFQSIHP